MEEKKNETDSLEEIEKTKKSRRRVEEILRKNLSPKQIIILENFLKVFLNIEK